MKRGTVVRGLLGLVAGLALWWSPLARGVEVADAPPVEPQIGEETTEAAVEEGAHGAVEPAEAVSPGEEGEVEPEEVWEEAMTEEVVGEWPDEGDDEELGFQDGRVTVDFKEADIRDVLQVFSRKARVNIVPSPSVQGTVTIRLTDVHWEKALRLILENQNFTLRKDEDNIYRVLAESEVQLEPLVTRVYPLSYTRAEEVEEIIAPLLTPERGQVQYDKASNTLVVSDVPTQFETIEMVLQQLDRQVQQVTIEVKILERTSIAGKDVGIKWDFLEAWELGAEKIVARDYTRTETDRDRFLDFRQMDTSQRFEPVVGQRTVTTKGLTIVGDPEQKEPSHLTERLITRTAILSAADAKVTLSALLSDTNTELISNPKIATVDNRKATINVTREIPIPSYTYNDQTGTYEISAFEYKPVGIMLSVTPQVNQDDYITLDVEPEVSTQYDEKTFVISGGAIDIPIIDKRTAQTRVIVKSNETLVIGGLVSTEETKVVKKVPLLGDIPILGHVFRHTSTMKAKKDLLLFITPTIVSGQAVDAL